MTRWLRAELVARHWSTALCLCAASIAIALLVRGATFVPLLAHRPVPAALGCPCLATLGGLYPLVRRFRSLAASLVREAREPQLIRIAVGVALTVLVTASAERISSVGGLWQLSALVPAGLVGLWLFNRLFWAPVLILSMAFYVLPDSSLQRLIGAGCSLAAVGAASAVSMLAAWRGADLTSTRQREDGAGRTRGNKRGHI
ncbi:hypothetical protein [Cellulomonas alba]|uniref:Uncharacterized protein n=1 Tax=Cellulomonas alba TaxID=3053467 RepID=A0ABT7SJ81_9CELL|nr:hypothetical protein [Cellulomonas alba]MDM7856242.1 hypothetical protein [Cellulomonas alba]